MPSARKLSITTLLSSAMVLMAGCDDLSRDLQARDLQDGTGAAEPATSPGSIFEPGAAADAASILSVAEKSRIYALAASVDAAGIGALFDRTLASEANPERTFTLQALFERWSEVDPPAAAAILDEPLPLIDGDLIGRVFDATAASDPELALDLLEGFATSGNAIPFGAGALAVLEPIRDDPSALARWLDIAQAYRRIAARTAGQLTASGLFGVYPVDLESQGLLALAEIDAYAALDWLRDVEGERQRLLIGQISSSWPAFDALAALEQTASIRDEPLRNELEWALLHNLARSDPLAPFRYVATAAQRRPEYWRGRSSALQSLAQAALAAGSDPLELFQLATTLPDDLAEPMQLAAVVDLGRRDPVAAASRLETLAPDRRQTAARRIARTYAETDPAAALDWAGRLSLPGIQLDVLRAVATGDPVLALELALGGSVRSRGDALTTVVTESIRRDPAIAADIARRLSGRLPDSGLYDNVIVELAGTWTEREPEVALDWLVSAGTNAPQQAFERAVRAVWRQPELAARYVDLIPDAAREDWIATVAAGFAQSDPDRAIDWVDRFRGDAEAVARGRIAIIQRVAQTDPARAADLFADFPESENPEQAVWAATELARTWARSNPAAAASWATEVADETVRLRAVQEAARNWIRRDPDSARVWIFSRPRDPTRDRLIEQYLSLTVDRELPPASIFDELSSDESRRRAMANIVANTGSDDPARLREWLERTNAAPELRRQAEENLAQIERMMEHGITTGVSSGLIFMPVQIGEQAPAPLPE